MSIKLPRAIPVTTICLISDTHGHHRSIIVPACDILIHAGDFSTVGQEQPSVLDDADQWFEETGVDQVVCIGGNHDFPLHNDEFHFSHAIYLRDRLAEVAGLSIYGSPWCPDLSNFAFYATEDELIERWKAIPSGIDVLVTHTPPHGILDMPSSGLTHLGCPHLRRELKRIKPRLHVFGHVHASRGMQDEGDTRFVNAAVVGGPALKICHGPTLITVH
ncbi:MAG: metallophosphoesterase [Verrucomicrobiaceae bacterium]|nr:MAG: metallophosphoesterase [Verrucomicrobiaceae bacterium]